MITEHPRSITIKSLRQEKAFVIMAVLMGLCVGEIQKFLDFVPCHPGRDRGEAARNPGRSSSAGRERRHQALASWRRPWPRWDAELDDAGVAHLEEPYAPHTIAGFR